jgi:hypothetical protein
MTAISGGEAYSLAQVQTFYATEYPALHGTSPDVYAQNQALAARIQAFTTDAEYPIMGVQLLGSRANGSAGLSSDVDLATIHLGRSSDKRVRFFDRMLQYAVEPIGYDSWGAMAMHGIHPNIPDEPGKFVERAASMPWTLVALHEQGLYAAPELKLCAFAVTTIMAGRRSLRTNWGIIRKAHAEAYVTGHVPRTAQKIAERLGISASADEILPPPLIAERIDRFGLPHDFGTYHETLEAWAAANEEAMQGSRVYPILEAARRL